jgi:DNA-binding XRE family transcriptional regulator
MDTTSLNDRILTFINSLSISHATFADEIGVQRSAIAHIAKGRNRPSLEMVTKITDRYPEINVMWLLKGTGSMMNNTPNVISLQQRQVIPSSPVIDDSLKHTLFAQEEEKNTSIQKNDDESFSTSQAKEPTVEIKSSHRSYSVNDFDEEDESQTSAVQPTPPSVKESHSAENLIPAAVMKKEKKISRIVVFYDDNSYEEFAK